MFKQHGELSSTLSLMGSNLISLTTVNLQTKERKNHCLAKALKTVPASDGGVQPTLKIHPLSASPGMYTGLSLTVSQGWCRISTPQLRITVCLEDKGRVFEPISFSSRFPSCFNKQFLVHVEYVTNSYSS